MIGLGLAPLIPLIFCNRPFFIEPFSGAVRSVRSLTSSDQASYSLTVVAKDHGHPQLSSSVDVQIDLECVDAGTTDAPPTGQPLAQAPRCTGSRTFFMIPRTSNTGLVITTVQATDPNNSPLTYDLSPVDGQTAQIPFNIGPDGTISLSRPVPAATPRFRFQWRATNAGGQVSRTTNLPQISCSISTVSPFPSSLSFPFLLHFSSPLSLVVLSNFCTHSQSTVMFRGDYCRNRG